MEIKEIIDGLQFTIDMFMINTATGEEYTKPRNDLDAITIDACREAIKILDHLERGAMVSRYKTFKVLEAIKNECENNSECHKCPYDETICFTRKVIPEKWNLKALGPKILFGGKNDGN